MKIVPSLIVILVSFVSLFNSNIFAQEILVTNAKVIVRFETDIVATSISNSQGEIIFTVPSNILLPLQGQFSFEVFPPAKLREDTIIIWGDFNLLAVRKNNMKFIFVLKYTPQVGAQNRGAFAVSGKNST